eukprot:jgi/Tetstr1/431288/TSEL_020982.t2
MGSAEFTELLELYKDRVYDANIASAARQRFGGVFGRNDRDHLSGRRRQPRELQDHALGARGGVAFRGHASGRAFQATLH